MMMAEKIPLPILQLDHAMALLEDHSYAQVVKLTRHQQVYAHPGEKVAASVRGAGKIKEPPSTVRGSSFWVK